MVKEVFNKLGYDVINRASSLNRNLPYQLTRLISEPAPVLIDVGANEGQTIDMFSQCFPDGFIYAFEPSTETFKRLSANHYGDNVQLFNCGLGRTREIREFLNYEDSRLSSFYAINENPEMPFRAVKLARREQVEVDTLDAVIERHALKQIHLLKIDTQGFDFEVLLGAEHALMDTLIDIIQIELNFAQRYHGQEDPLNISRFLNGYGFALVDYYEIMKQDKWLGWCTALFARK